MGHRTDSVWSTDPLVFRCRKDMRILGSSAVADTVFDRLESRELCCNSADFRHTDRLTRQIIMRGMIIFDRSYETNHSDS